VREMVLRLLRQRFGNLGIVLILLSISVLTVLSFASGRGGPAPLAILLLAPGAISRDISSGAAQMILARPIRRSEYLLGRYLGIVVAYGGFVLLSALLCFLLRPVFTAALGLPQAVAPAELMQVAAGEWLDGSLLAATLLFFSTFLPGIGDLLAYLLLQIGLGIAGSLQAPFPRLASIASAIRGNLLPDVDWPQVFHGNGALQPPFGSFVLALTVFLVGALFIFSRREFSYGQD
jgi:ABC-type transport system involved in multi-copper enzyme maturation permease subunit